MNVAENLERAAEAWPGAPAIEFEGRTILYGELEAEVSRTAGGLAALGVGFGDRVALLLPNLPEFAVAYLGVQKLGAVAVSFSAMLKTEELAYLLDDCEPCLIFTTAALLPELAPLAGRLTLPPIILCEGEAAGTRTLAELGEGQPVARRCRAMAANDPAALLYTSGTTGKQKGALLSHGNVVSNYRATNLCTAAAPGDRHALIVPLFHCFAQNFILNAALNSGGTVLLHRRFDPASTAAGLGEQGVTHLYGVPTVFIHLLAGGVSPQTLPALRYSFSAAASLPVEVARRWQDAFGMPVMEGYGLTETSPLAAYNHLHAHRPGSIGSPVPGVEMRVVGADDREVADGEWGEICIRGANVMLGYYHRPDETLEALRGGWFHTGDVGYRDRDGYYYLVDRVKDMINAAGFKVWPREVEEVLYTHAGVRECAVVGLPDPLSGEAVAAFVVPRPGAGDFDAEEMIAWCRERMASYKVPRRIALVDSIPKSPTGKVLKRQLREV